MCAKNLFSIESRLISTIGPAMEKITVSSSWKLIYIFAPIRLYSGRLVKRKPKCAWVEFVTLLATAALSVTRVRPCKPNNLSNERIFRELKEKETTQSL